jgi:hypothetical protein
VAFQIIPCGFPAATLQGSQGAGVTLSPDGHNITIWVHNSFCNTLNLNRNLLNLNEFFYKSEIFHNTYLKLAIFRHGFAIDPAS